MLLTGCYNINEPVRSTSISIIDTNKLGHKKHLNNYDSPYTICYMNEDDTYTMYIFASPIQYKTESGEYAIIDNTVIKTNKPNFIFENKANNIKTYFPKTLLKSFLIIKEYNFLEFKLDWDINGFSEAKQTTFTNMYNDEVSAVVYERKDMDLVFYPTKAGIKTELVLKEKPEDNKFAFIVKSGASEYENNQNGYILFKNGYEEENIIYQPLVQYTANKGRQLDVTTQMNIYREESGYYVGMIIDDNVIENAKYPIKLDPSFEMCLNKIPDSTVYSKHDINNYLASFGIVGGHPIFGEGWHYSRLRLNYFMTLKQDSFKSAVYYIKTLCDNTKAEDFKTYESSEQWSSTGMLWESKKPPGKLISEKTIPLNGYWGISMNEYVKACFDDPNWEKESVGFLMKVEKQNAYRIIATSDNSLYSPFLKIELTKLPAYFELKENINQVQF